VKPGEVLQQRYQIVGRLGAGGQATVFEANDRRLGIHVAVKRSEEQREEWREAFVREARLLASLRHPSLPIVSDHFEDADSQYLVLELVPGDDLEERVERQDHPCTVDEVLAWADQLLDALDYLHGQSPPIIHRDIKPRNLKLRPDGRLILLDFGLAKGRPRQDPEREALASLHGYSYGYAPLEQILSEGTDVRSDLYAVGATLYFLLSGRHPTDAAIRDRDRGLRGDPIRPLESLNAEVPGLLAGLVHRALELQPDRRFQTADEMRRALADARRALTGWQDSGPRLGQPDDDADAFADLPTIVPISTGRPTTVSLHEPGSNDFNSAADPHRAATASSETTDEPADLVSGDAPEDVPAAAAPAVPPVPPRAADSPERRRSQPSHRLGAGFRLALAHGEQPADSWALATDRPNSIGRNTPGSPPPDVDLWPDRRASREHARFWSTDHGWSIEDAGSKHGTRVDGRPLSPGEAVTLHPWSEVEIGETTLFLAPPGWHRVRSGGLTLDLEVVGAISASLLHAGLPIVRRLVARNRGQSARPAGRVELSLPPWFGPVTVEVPPLEPGASQMLTLPPISPGYDVLEGQIERARRRLAIEIDGVAPRGEPVECWLLPHNEWSTLAEHRTALASFVLPNHPAVAALAVEVTAAVNPDARAEQIIGALFEVMAGRWQIAYRLEPPHWAADSQKVRLPHQVLLDDAGRRGEGTCLDLALLFAACLENLGLQAVVAIIDVGQWWHALVGCWDPPEPALETLRFDARALMDRAIWVDPTCASRDERIRRPFAAARTEAERTFVEGSLIFALDVAAARNDGITPLPFAGLPSWSPGVSRVIEAASAHAKRSSTQLCSATLLASLLTDGDGLTGDLVGSVVGDVAMAERTIVAALPPSPPTPPASAGYRQILDAARTRARSVGSPTVLEVHVLGALLSTRSASLDRALGLLGTDQQRLLQALGALEGGADPLSSAFSGWR
jgi:serine/threonine protein kinase